MTEALRLRAIAAVALVSVALLHGALRADAQDSGSPLFDVPSSGCIRAGQVASNLDPLNLMNGAMECIHRKKFDLAVELYHLAGIRANFDKLRVKDISAHSAVAAMNLRFGEAVTENERQRFAKAAERFGGNGSPKHRALCRLMAKRGPPTHSPDYMIRHGMRAFFGNGGTRLVDDFDPAVAWRAIQNDYLHCR